MTYKSTASNATRAASPTRQVWFSRTDVIITCSYPDDRDTSTPTTTVTYAQQKHEESGVSRKQDPMAAAMRRARRSRNGSILREAVSYVREIVAVQHKIRRKYRPEEATVVLGRYATLKTKLNRIEAWEKARGTTHDAMKIHQEASVESRNAKRRRCCDTNEKRSLVKLLFRGFPTGAQKSKASFFAAAPPARQISAY
ncbi:expressed unknown protein [Seminavis robusta]|uniref:Uncharacterized protein n=1 Tax=Seminavis robusta TaxID=568900 RepID=A0A9N8END4_9STRA|nr:expressed unknown protein [Seminavis robusta]|eukprot:Sro1275_g258510.1 n/a (198) ;mRNA; f:27142-27735